MQELRGIYSTGFTATVQDQPTVLKLRMLTFDNEPQLIGDTEIWLTFGDSDPKLAAHDVIKTAKRSRW